MSQLARHSLIYLSSNVLTAALPFLLLPILTRYLSPFQYGQVATFQTLAALGLLVIGLNLHGAVSVQKYKNEVGLPVFVATCIIISLIVTLVVAVGFLPLYALIGESLGLPGGWLFFAVLCGLAGALTWQRLILWQTSDRPIPYGGLNFSLAAANLGLSLWLVIGLKMGADGRVIAIVASAILFGLLAALSLRRDGLLVFRWSGSAATRALRFGLPLLPHSLAGIAMLQADRFLLGQRLGLDEAGVYAVAMQLTLPVVIVADSFNRAYTPWLYRQLSQGNREVALAVSLIGVGGALVGTALLVGLAYAFVPLILGDEFVQVRGLLVWLAPAVAAQAAYFMAVNFIFYSEKTALIPVVTSTAALAYVGCGFLAVHNFGAFGLALTYSLISVIQTIAIFHVAQRVYPMPWFSREAYSNGFRTIGARLSR